MIRSRHSALYAEVAAMKVGDCLQWDIPVGSSARGLFSSLHRFVKRSSAGSIVRLHLHNRRLFIVRIA